MPSAWEIIQKQQQEGTITHFLAIIVPHLGETSTEWALNLRNITVPNGTQVLTGRGMPIDVTRDRMTNEALDAGFEWLFYLDSDVILPKNAIMTLLSHNLPIVSGMYRAKKPDGFSWTMWVKREVDGEIRLFPVDTWKGRLIPVETVGCGCLLVHRSVFEKIRKETDLPFFFWTDKRDKSFITAELPDPIMNEVSEDFWFCLLAVAHGFQIAVDTTIACEHVATVKLAEDKVTLPSI
jgi:hypothetical protein